MSGRDEERAELLRRARVHSPSVVFLVERLAQ
jgi:hypothetical protein